VSSISAELPGTASGENPAPGTGAPSAFNGTTATISSFLLASSQTFAVEILSVPHRKHSLGLGAGASRFEVPRQTGGNGETLNELQSAYDNPIHRQERLDHSTVERNTGHQVLSRDDTLLEGRSRRMEKQDAMALSLHLDKASPK
jgi:hypothetical protein